MESKLYFSLKNKTRSFSTPLRPIKSTNLNTLIEDLYFRTIHIKVNLRNYKIETDKLDISRADNLIYYEILNFALRRVFDFDNVVAQKLDAFLEYMDRTIEDKITLSKGIINESQLNNRYAKEAFQKEQSTKKFFLSM